MKIAITKEYQVTAEFDAPDGLTEQELLDWAADKADEMTQQPSVKDDWSATYVHDEDANEPLFDW